MSDVVRLRQRLQDEYTSMRNGMHEFSAGNARHEFIRKKMQQADRIQDQLMMFIDERQAIEIVCTTYNQVMDKVQG
ncbi:hypothetical protein KDW_30770 [Dictyobacter vulcani]|uniref:Uncharacterized protein n=1 Tax=Dictyobacter vulcani TaxID=2607529 RepID=A0A5J4KM19_9CHLR|nr:hypothetical protein [Dictyobacter vulcani]GER88915.1 hypothetical protein KDW_30770 [Dictyobacter vulcani]